jgi:hypothetical protein
VEAEALRSWLLQSRSFRLQNHPNAKSAIHRNADQLVRLCYILNY